MSGDLRFKDVSILVPEVRILGQHKIGFSRLEEWFKSIAKSLDNCQDSCVDFYRGVA